MARVTDVLRTEYGQPYVVSSEKALLDAIYETAGIVEVLRNAIVAVGRADDENDVARFAGVFRVFDNPQELRRVYELERDRLVRFVTEAKRLKLEERSIEIAETTAAKFVEMLQAVIDHERLGLTDEQKSIAHDLTLERLRLVSGA